LTACLLALILCPVPLIVLGARGDLRAVFYLVALPPYLAAAGFLLARYLARPTERPTSGPFLLEGLSWMIVLAFLTVVSGIHLLVGIERLGAIGESFLMTLVVCVPIAVKRRSALERRLTAFSKGRAVGLVVVIVGLATVGALLDAATPSRFPGG
jgi:hypothetical protein